VVWAAAFDGPEPEEAREADRERLPFLIRFKLGLAALLFPLGLITGLTAGRYDSSNISTSSELLLETDMDAAESRLLRLGTRPDFVGLAGSGDDKGES
jgi:hypothetical protein